MVISKMHPLQENIFSPKGKNILSKRKTSLKEKISSLKEKPL